MVALCPLRKKLAVEQVSDARYVAEQEFMECVYTACAWYDVLHEECSVRFLAKFLALRREL
jgi:hypothetical protein